MVVKNILNRYVLTGGPSSGKTTVLKELSKLGYTVFPEVARIFVDKEMAEGKSLKNIRGDESKFQKKTLKIKLEMEEVAPQGKIVFFDRGIPDSIAYYQLCGLNPKKALAICQERRYRKIFFLEQLPFKKDYARIEDEKTVQKLNKLLRKAYQDLGYNIVSIPVMSVEERSQRILNEINYD